MKIEKDGEVRQIVDMNWGIWKRRGWSKYEPKRKRKASVETAEAASGAETAETPKPRARKRRTKKRTSK